MPECRAQQLLLLGRFREAAEHLSSRQHLTKFEQIVKVWLEFELGDAAHAHADAMELMKGSHDPLFRAYCFAIAGRAIGRRGSPHAGLTLIRKAIALAADVDARFEAQLEGIYTNSLLTWVGLEPALVQLPRLRQAATRSGDRRALVDYHIARSRIALLKGAPQVALTEIKQAQGLLDAEQYPDLLWRVKELQSAAMLTEGNLRAARAYAEECLAVAQDIGSKRRIANTTGNLAHIAATAGDFKNAERFLRQSLQLMDAGNPARMGLLSTGLNIASATGNRELADDMLEQAAAMSSSEPKDQEAYYPLWFEFYKARWLIRNGDLPKAAELASRSIDAAARLAEQELCDHFRLLCADASVRLRRMQQAERALCTVEGIRRNPSLRLLTSFLRVSSQFRQERDPDAAYGTLEMAHRLLTSSELLGLRREVEQTEEAFSTQGREPVENGDSLELSVAKLAFILQLGRHPRVLGSELIELLRRCNVASDPYRLTEEHGGKVATVASINDASWPKHSNVGNDFKLFLGEDGWAKYFLRTLKPTSLDSYIRWISLAQLVRAALALQGRLPEQPLFTETWSSEAPGMQFGMIVVSNQSIDLMNDVRKLAPSNITVLINGETGTGKELLARALHDASPRAGKPFVPFNCSAVSRDLLDAQLFGYRKGAFTGAHEAFHGVIRAAAGGTLFLDEIGEITPDVQPKLLRFLESGEIHPLGEPRPTQVNVRILAATNADLEKLVAEGRFREDLFYRLNVVRLQVPSLRERREEIPPLVHHFLDKFSRDAHKTGLRIADETMEYLILYRWPGNVRQLANEVRRLVALAESGAVLMPEHLSPAIASSRRTVPATDRPPTPTELIVRLDQPMSAATDHLERAMIQYAMKLSGGRVEDAAERLGLSRKGLYLKRQRLQIGDLTEDDADADTPAATASGAHVQ